MKKSIFLSIALITLFFSCSKSENDSELEIPEKEEEVVNEELCNIASKDGLLIIEAESFDLKGKWRVVEDKIASNGKYIEYFGSNSYNSPNLAHEITVKFTIEKASSYLVRWFMRQPDEAEGDKSNDVWIYFTDGVGHGRRDGEPVQLTEYEKFVSRGKGEFTYGGALDLHNPKASSWMRAEFPEAGEYTLKICARSEFFQLDKLVLSSGMSDLEAQEKSKTRTETIECN